MFSLSGLLQETPRLHAGVLLQGGRPQLGPILCTNGWCAVHRVHQWVHRLQLPQTALQVLQSPQAPLVVWPPDLVCTRGGSTETRGAAGSAMPRIVVWCT